MQLVENDSQLQAVPLWREPDLKLEENISKKKAKKARKWRAQANGALAAPSRRRRGAVAS